MNGKGIRYLIFVYLLLLQSCVFEAYNECDDFQKKYPIIIEQNKTDTQFLVKTLTKMLELNNCIDARLTRGDLLSLIGGYEDAKTDFSKVIQSDSLNTYALFKIGVLYQFQDQYDSSILFFNKAIGTKVNNGAVIDFSKLPDNIQTSKDKYDIEYHLILYRLSLSFYYQGLYELALKSLNECIRVSYLLDKVYALRGLVFVELNKKDKACVDFKSAVSLGNIKARDYLTEFCGDENKVAK